MKYSAAIALGVAHLFFAVTALASQAAWATDMGPQLVLQDPASNLFHHSTCNTSADLVFPKHHPLILETEFPPKANTSLAGVGWFDAVTTWACLWYQDTSNNLIYSRYECNSTSGAYELRDSEAISTAFPQGVNLHTESALAAVLLGAEEGIRVYAHDKKKKVHELSFQNPTGWQYGGLVTNKTGHGLALAAAASVGKEVTVIVPADDSLQLLKKGIGQQQWNASIFKLDSKMASSATEVFKHLALTINEEGNRSLFFIGTDKRLHQVNSPASDSTIWKSPPSQPEDVWPKGYDAETPLAVTSRRGAPRFALYYQTSLTNLVSLTYSDKFWSTNILPILTPAVAPFITPDSDTPKDEPSEHTSEHPSEHPSEHTLPREAVITLSTALPILFLAICGVAVYLHRTRKPNMEPGPHRTSSRTRPRSTDVAFRHVRPYSEFGDLSWEDGASETATNTSPWRRKRGWTC